MIEITVINFSFESTFFKKLKLNQVPTQQTTQEIATDRRRDSMCKIICDIDSPKFPPNFWGNTNELIISESRYLACSISHQIKATSHRSILNHISRIPTPWQSLSFPRLLPFRLPSESSHVGESAARMVVYFRQCILRGCSLSGTPCRRHSCYE